MAVRKQNRWTIPSSQSLLGPAQTKSADSLGHACRDFFIGVAKQGRWTLSLRQAPYRRARKIYGSGRALTIRAGIAPLHEAVYDSLTEGSQDFHTLCPPQSHGFWSSSCSLGWALAFRLGRGLRLRYWAKCRNSPPLMRTAATSSERVSPSAMTP